jgi:hypothetical protein
MKESQVWISRCVADLEGSQFIFSLSSGVISHFAGWLAHFAIKGLCRSTYVPGVPTSAVTLIESGLNDFKSFFLLYILPNSPTTLDLSLSAKCCYKQCIGREKVGMSICSEHCEVFRRRGSEQC